MSLTSHALPEVHEEAVVSPKPGPAVLFKRKDLPDKLWGIWQKDKETPHSRQERGSLCVRSVYAFVFM